jgi:predicted nucleic acid-binding protein
MLTYVLDTSAPIRLLDSEPGWERVDDLLASANRDECEIQMCAVNWGELIYAIGRRYPEAVAAQVEMRFSGYPIIIVPADSARATNAGRLKLKYNIGYADSFGVELALQSPDHVLVTADYGVKPAEHDIRIEFLPTKPKQ